MAKMTNADFGRLIRSEEIQKAVRPPKKIERTVSLKKNPLKNIRVMLRLNPYASVLKRAAVLQAQRKKALDAKTEADRTAGNWKKVGGGKAKAPTKKAAAKK